MLTARQAWGIAVMMFVLIAWSASAGAADEKTEKKPEFAGISRAAQTAMDRWLAALADLKTYEDEGTVEWKTGLPFGGQEQKASFQYAKPDRFRIQNSTMDVSADGKELTVYRRNNRRYLVESLQSDALTQVQKHGVSTMANFLIAEMVLAKDPRKYAAERFRNLDVTGHEDIDGEKCTKLEGRLVSPGGIDAPEGRPVKLFLREKDWMLRRVEVDMSEPADEDDDSPFGRIGRNQRVVYELKNARANREVNRDQFTFKPPAGAKKVDQFFSAWMHSGDTAQQFALSGKPAPDFTLDTHDGREVSLSEKKGSVVLLQILPQRPMGRMARRFRNLSPPLDKLDQLQKDFADRGLTVWCVHPGESADELVEEMREKNQSLTILLDPFRDVVNDYMGEVWGSSLILIGKDGIVQGRYPSYLGEENLKSVRADVEKLLSGETLAGGKPMTDEQMHEAEEQQAAFFMTDSADPINEQRIAESWSVRSGAGMGRFPERTIGGSTTRSSLWIQSRDALQEVDAAGKVLAEIPIPRPTTGDGVQEEFVVGRMAGRRVVVHMASIPGDAQESAWGWRPPKGAVITAGDESGQELWSLEVETRGRQLPQHLSMGDIDGRDGDEVAFIHDGSLWILNERGEVVVRRQVPGFVSWMRLEDLDRDQRAEVYIRSQNKLHRFDFKGEK